MQKMKKNERIKEELQQCMRNTNVVVMYSTEATL